MATYLFSSLSNGQHLAFAAAGDILGFDSLAATAGEVRISSLGGNLGFSYGGKTVWLDGMSVGQLSEANLSFANGSYLLAGDGTVSQTADWYGQDYSALASSTVGNQIWGLGGADVVQTGSGADYIVGNAALTPLNHVSRAGTTGSPTGSFNPSISADGRFVAFDGGWTGFGSSSNNAQDVLVKNMDSGAISNEHKSAGGQLGLSGAGGAQISADGKWLAFMSSSGLVAGTPPSGTIYVASTTSNTLKVASTTAGGAFANGFSDNPDISANGRYVVFESRATNLVPTGANASYDDIFVKDLQTGAIQRVSTSLTGGDANADCTNARISADGRFVVFSSGATNLSSTRTGSHYSDIYVWDRTDGSLTNVTGAAAGAFESLNPDVAYDNGYGGVVVFETGKALVADDTNNTTDVYAFNLGDLSFQRVSTKADGSQIAGASQDAAISGDGRWVVFRSFSDNVVTGDTNGYADIFVKDLFTGEIARVSNPAGGQANQTASRGPEISLGGDWIVFESSASNLAGTDGNGGLTDVFRVSNPLLKDQLEGGAGNDTYVIARADTIIELAGGGTDTVQSSISYTLGANLENLVLTGSAALNGTGNAGNNAITGNTAANRLKGGAGADTLRGQAGNDTLLGEGGNDVLIGDAGNDTLTGGIGTDFFVFNSLSGNDTFTDFLSGTDKMRISQAALKIGDGDLAIEGGLIRAAPGGFSTGAELVIFSTNLAGLGASAAAAAIGAATTAYAAGAQRLFAVDNGVSSAVYLFKSAANDAAVSASELTLLGTLNGTAATALADYAFVA